MTSHDRANAIGEFHSARLAGDRLVNKRYEPVDIAELTSEVLQDHSEVLNLNWLGRAVNWVATTLQRGCTSPPLRASAPVPIAPKQDSAPPKTASAN